MRLPAKGGFRRQSSKTATIPAPTKGWNAKDSYANMGAEYAVKLENWWVTPTNIELRPGYVDWATGLPGYVSTLIPYNATTSKLFAVSGGGFYDVTSGGAVGAAVVSGLASDKFEYAQTSTTAGVFLYAVNGTDSARLYDGTKWVIVDDGTGKVLSTITHATTTATATTATAHNLVTGQQIVVAGAAPAEYNGTFTVTVTGANTFTYVMSSAPATDATVTGTYTVSIKISGVTTSKLAHVNIFKTRLFFIEKDSLNAWYLPAVSIGGTASKIDLGSVFKRGGSLVSMATWSLDGGNGIDDYAVWITSQGEVAVYQGSDPASPSTWALVGVFQLGTPMGRKCFLKLGGDLAILSKDGLSPLSKSLVSTRLHNKAALTDAIQSAVSSVTTSYSANSGWQMILYPPENALILNVPVSSDAQQQFVMNTISGAWCKFTGWAANCWELFGDVLYFGGNTKVCRAWYGTTDNGAAIRADALQAFSYYGKPTQLKRFLEARPILSSDGSPSIWCGVNLDFDLVGNNQPVTLTPYTSGEWDSGKWDSALWGGSFEMRSTWQFVSGVGYAAGIRLMAVAKNTSLQWSATDIVLELGGVI